MNDSCLQIFAKAPVPGRVKTRMQPVLNPEECARLAENMLRKTLKTAAMLENCDVQLWCFPDTSNPVFTEAQETYGVELVKQVGADLGDRMLQAINAGLTVYKRVILIGSDCPAMDQAYLQQAFDLLEKENQNVIGPAKDGGYVLIGANHILPEKVFRGLAWGTETVLRETLDRMELEKLQPRLLPELSDIDEPEDLKNYATTLYG